MYKIDELISKLQTSLTAATEATIAAKNADLPSEAITQVEETEAKIKATLDAMIHLGHRRGAEESFTVRKKPLDLDLSRKPERNS
jgi:hypothetical protein